MKINIRKTLMMALMAGLLVFSPVQSFFAEAASQVSGSSDSRLSILDIKPGTLNPAFSPDIYEYTATVESGVTSVEVQAVPNAAGGTIASVEGASGLQEGLNKITVVSSAPDQSYVSYTINLTVGEAAAEEESVADLDTQVEDTADTEEQSGGKAAKLIGNIGNDGKVVLDGASYQLSNNFSISEIAQAIPSGYEQGSADISGTTYQTVFYKKSNVSLVFMENTDGSGSTGFYFYDELQNSVERFKYLSVGESYLVMMNQSREEIPAGFTRKVVTLPSEKKVFAYENPLDEDMKQIYLVYGVSSKGVMGWYYYDKSEGTYMRYLQPEEPAVPVMEESEEEPESQRTVSLEKYNTLYAKYNDLKKGQVRLVSIAMIALVLLLIIFTVIYMKWKDLLEESAEGGQRPKVEKQKSKASLQNGQKRLKKQQAAERTVISKRKEELEKAANSEELERMAQQERRQKEFEERHQREIDELERKQREVEEQNRRQREVEELERKQREIEEQNRRQREVEELERRQREFEEQNRKQREFEERERQRAAYERVEQLEYQKEMQAQAKQASEEVRETMLKNEPSVVRKTILTREAQQSSEDAMIQAQEKMRQSVQLARRVPVKDPTRQIPDVDKESVFRPTKRIKLSEAEKQKEHDPMDDWEVEETSGTKREKKKKRGRLEEGMEIMDLNDI